MKTGLVERHAFVEKQAAEVTPDDLAKINRYTRRELSAQDVYAFPLTLCGNEIDRDHERFSIPALLKLAELFLGKTGIFDHKPTATSQTARIYDTAVEEIEGKVTAAGEPYTRLTAKAYMLRDDNTAAIVRSIDAGILKEISVGCAVERVLCSVCGADQKSAPCEHRPGVDGVHNILDCPTDAYEWSFVAVPSQRDAGVTKQHEYDIERKSQIDAILAECADIMKNFKED